METNVEYAERLKKLAAGMRKEYTGPMTDAEVALLRDIQAFIEFAIRNGLGCALVLGMLMGDIKGIADYGMSYEEARSHGFLPRVSHFSETSAESVGEPDESLD